MNSDRWTFERDDRSSTMDLGHATSSYDVANYDREHAKPGLPSASAKKLAKGLGWFSIGLGLTELLAPRFIANISGVPNARTGLIRLYGLREIASGITIFSRENPVGGVWSRVAGDAFGSRQLRQRRQIAKREHRAGRIGARKCTCSNSPGRYLRKTTEQQRQPRHSRESQLHCQ